MLQIDKVIYEGDQGVYTVLVSGWQEEDVQWFEENRAYSHGVWAANNYKSLSFYREWSSVDSPHFSIETTDELAAYAAVTKALEEYENAKREKSSAVCG